MPPLAKVEAKAVPPKAKCVPATLATAENWNCYICKYPEDSPFPMAQVAGITGLWARTCHGLGNVFWSWKIFLIG